MFYWESPGPENTLATLNASIQRARQLNINDFVVASLSGETILQLLQLDQHLTITCVTHHVGFKGPGIDEMKREDRKMLESRGIRVLTTTHLFAGVDRGIRNHFGGVYPAEIIASTLRIFGQGVKVAVEIASMALDAGMIPYGQDVISIGGSGRGADAAIVIAPAHSQHFFQTEVKEMICMPRVKKRREN